MGRLEGKRAVILGAAGKDNMGQVIGKRFRDEGAMYWLLDERKKS